MLFVSFLLLFDFFFFESYLFAGNMFVFSYSMENTRNTIIDNFSFKRFEWKRSFLKLLTWMVSNET